MGVRLGMDPYGRYDPRRLEQRSILVNLFEPATHFFLRDEPSRWREISRIKQNRDRDENLGAESTNYS